MKPKSGKYITFLPDELIVPVGQKDESVLDVALRNGVNINHTCGGNGTCGTCLLWVEEGLEELHPRSELEAEMAMDRTFRKEERLACQIHPIHGLKVRIPSGS
ncbi:2Fe-2S iron-sulfur cluster-binding protein [Bdellovibrio sp. 22V]|uniref:2Fe-2S iron-sulfur cluster-binding protein n=1 Tax=Bdellovibrio sp. 22V TaxID=3044166 RepID=UPI002542744B|nr:2Fe-2S iron-sulfur cluster-binding protein [Bdellovibrio sp. 22V]WII72760.1 2Fe-2S iron-sulfur cluster-binding protein [Bdellovibrio sp. 22V]